MQQLEKIFVHETTGLLEALRVMTEAAQYGLPAGIVLVGNPAEPLKGIVTDGDVRRGLSRGAKLDSPISEVMTLDPIVFSCDTEYAELIRDIPKALAEKKRYRERALEKLILVDELGRVTQVLDFLQFWRQQQAIVKPVTVIGLGYVGLTLAAVMAEVGYRVVGVEREERVLNLLRQGESPFDESGLLPLLHRIVGAGRLSFVQDLSQTEISHEVYILAVGTPLGHDKKPYLKDLESAAMAVSARLKPGALIIVRSTVPVGTCREVILPALERSGLNVDQDFLLAFAPERTVEGQALSELRSLPQIIGGHSQTAAEQAANVFRELTGTVVIMDSLEEAEMAKLVNNSFRDLSFAFSNELALICQGYNLDAGRIIRAANDGYPRNPIPQPSPGVGGPCLTKDPYFYAAVAERAGLTETLAVRGRKVNERITLEIGNRILAILADNGVASKDARVLVVGVAFKGWPETTDVRNSSSLTMVDHLRNQGVTELRAIDPVVPVGPLNELGLKTFQPENWQDGFQGCHVILFMNNHPLYRKWDIYEGIRLMDRPAVIFDGWQIFDSKDLAALNGVHVLGLGAHRKG